MKLINKVVGILGLMLAFSASAHISLKQSTPADQAMLMQNPEQLSLIFSGQVRLARVMLTDSSKQMIDFDFKPSATLSSQFEWSLPSLSEGSYKVEWVVLGEDGHKMSGDFSFTLHASNSHNMKKMSDKSSSQHSH